MRDLTRRQFAATLLVSTLGTRLVDASSPVRARPGARLSARPTPARGTPAQPGPQPLALANARDGVVYVPRGYRPARPLPLVLALHGATGSSKGPVRNLGPLADDLGIALVVPDSRGRTWDAIMRGEFGPDCDFIDGALAAAWSRVQVDPKRIGVAGFSDGATYALALGRANGDLFSGVAAFSPGFLIPVDPVGAVPVFISHGTHDSVLPIDSCSRRIVPELRRLGHRVDYHEFDGDHTVPRDMASLGLAAAVTHG
jgi:phospholipase/carboxylesterase